MQPHITRLFFVPAMLCAFSQFPSRAETHALDKEKSAVMLETEAKGGVVLPAPNTVNANVGVKAVLLTQGAVGRLFGKEIAHTYAVVQLTISNKSADAAFVLHSAFIDTSQWALGGGTKGFQSGQGNPTTTGTLPNQISSVESRIARGQLLDAQQWSARNWTVRLLTVAGSLASGYSFAFKETGIAKGIAAFSGSLVPGVAFAWPDGAVAQLNRISDFGYQTNKTIGKQSADIIVCFFPIDMFLSKPFRKIFLDSPGLFLSPYQILFNKKILEDLHIEKQAAAAIPVHQCYSRIFELPTVKNRKDRTPAPAEESETLRRAVDDAIVSKCKSDLDANKDSLIFLDYIGRFGLQNIGVYVDGIMTVDVDTVPASIDDVSFANDATQSAFWNTNGQQNGTLLCRFCQGGKVDIVEKDKLGITNVTTADDSPNDKLNFSFMITKAVSTGTIIHFVITKPGDQKKGTKDVKSAPFSYSINYATAPK